MDSSWVKHAAVAVSCRGGEAWHASLLVSLPALGACVAHVLLPTIMAVCPAFAQHSALNGDFSRGLFGRRRAVGTRCGVGVLAACLAASVGGRLSLCLVKVSALRLLCGPFSLSLSLSLRCHLCVPVFVFLCLCHHAGVTGRRARQSRSLRDDADKRMRMCSEAVLTFGEVALAVFVAQALRMCRLHSQRHCVSASRQRPENGVHFPDPKGPKGVSPNCWGSRFWGLFCVRKMDAKLAPPFDFRVVFLFMAQR